MRIKTYQGNLLDGDKSDECRWMCTDVNLVFQTDELQTLIEEAVQEMYDISHDDDGDHSGAAEANGGHLNHCMILSFCVVNRILQVGNVCIFTF